MISIKNVEFFGFDAAVRGARNPMNSWAKSDSYPGFGAMGADVIIGKKDLDLLNRLRKAGTDHRKYMRMICVWCDITAPLYWWKEFDTYKVGTVANSCSTMHRIHSKELTLDDFSHDHMTEGSIRILENVIRTLNEARYAHEHFEELYSEGVLAEDINCKKDMWWQMIQLLPTSYNQKRTVMLNYEVLANIYNSRRNHKLDEWRNLCEWIETLPYSELITGKGSVIDE